jgi:hypothetical protein
MRPRKSRFRFSRCAGVGRSRRRGSRHAHLHVRRQRQRRFASALPVLEKMGKRVVLAGGAGAGQAAKICNNMLLAISMIGTCEAFVLGENSVSIRRSYSRSLRPRRANAGRSRPIAPCRARCPLACQSRLRAVLRRADAQGSKAVASGSPIVRRHDAARRRSNPALFAVRRARPEGSISRASLKCCGAKSVTFRIRGFTRL